MNKNICSKISIMKDRHGNIVKKIYYNDDMDIHRDNGPAIVWYFRDGKIDTEIYMKNGKKHREDGPAQIEYDEEGIIIYESWYREGKQHREGGPAVIIYDSNGKVHSESYWINGIQLDDELQIEICKTL